MTGESSGRPQDPVAYEHYGGDALMGYQRRSDMIQLMKASGRFR